jgi:hypothetical protein
MRKILISLLLAGLTALQLTAQAVQFQSSNLPIILINTNGQPIQDAPKITAALKVIDNGPGQLNHPNDPANGYDGAIGIEIRGSSSQLYEKKAYSIELDDATGKSLSTSLLGLPKESDFALIAPLNDKTLMRDMLAYKLAGEIMTWAPHTRYVEVMLNNTYQGVYMLVEKIKRDKNRVDISKLKTTDVSGDQLTGGYILSIDKFTGGGQGGDWSSSFSPFPGSKASTWFQIVYPKHEDIQPQQRAYIQQYITGFEKALYYWDPNAEPGPPVYESWIDADSWVDHLLINEITKNVDAYRISTYFYKNRDSIDPRIHMGPVWDYNITFGIGDYCDNQTPEGWMTNFNNICAGDAWQVHFWWPQLLRDYAFQQRITSRWQHLRTTMWSDKQLIACIDSTANLLAEAEVRNFKRWPVLGVYVWPNSFIGQTYQQEVDYLKKWLLQRVTWMDNHIERIGPLDLRHFPYLQDIRLYPNPVTAGGVLTFRYTTEDTAQYAFSLYDEMGRLVLSPQEMPSGNWAHYSLNLPANLGNGVYYYRLDRDDKMLKSGKLVVDR